MPSVSLGAAVVFLENVLTQDYLIALVLFVLKFAWFLIKD